MSACGRVKRYTPGPASYTPRVSAFGPLVHSPWTSPLIITSTGTLHHAYLCTPVPLWSGVLPALQDTSCGGDQPASAPQHVWATATQLHTSDLWCAPTNPQHTATLPTPRLQVDRHCTTLINSAAGSFPRASKDHCSHIQAHLQTVCSPGPAAAGAPRPHSSCNAYGNTSRSSSRSRSGSPTGHLLTARLQHTPGGTWCRSGVGTRESLRPKTAPARSSGGGSSSSGSGSRGDAKNDHEQQQQQQEQCVCRGGTSSCREGTCGMPWGEHLGPGRYDAAVQRDGSAVWFGSNGGGWTWGKAPKLAR
jgi:hypothetical protein